MESFLYSLHYTLYIIGGLLFVWGFFSSWGHVISQFAIFPLISLTSVLWISVIPKSKFLSYTVLSGLPF